jgi:apolipoprotein D and lipocalin family protein
VRRLFLLGLFLVCASSLSRAAPKDGKALQVVPSVDFPRYAGKWYEIARLPNRFQRGCAGEVAATYSLVEGTRLRVINECRTNDGRVERAEGSARVADRGSPSSKLEVGFAPSWLSWLPFVWGDYWVIALAEDYSYSVLGTPDRKYLWVLSRAPQMDEVTYKRLVEKAAAQGFDVTKLMKTRQSL